MFVKEIIAYDAFSQEADIIVSDNIYNIICYCHPADNNILGTEVKEIVSLFATEIIRSDTNEYFIYKDTQPYSYYVSGQVIDSKKPQISIGQIIITLDHPLPKDIKIGEYVTLKVDRFDCDIKKQF